jgi:hypothetical protein
VAQQLLVWVLGASNVFLAVLVFVLMARPERALGLVCRLSGMTDVWLSGRLSEAEEARLLVLARRLGWLLLVLLFGWSFVCGAILTWSQLGAGGGAAVFN